MKLSLLSLAALVLSVQAHMEILTPYPRRSKFSPDYINQNNVDYDNVDPLGNQLGYNKPFPCKGYAPGKVQATYKAGDTVTFNFSGNVIHNGGHCQFGMSYNNGQDIVVLKDYLTTCFLNGKTFTMQIPATAPASNSAQLVWGWINASGNREWYMNCVDVSITNPSASAPVTGPRMLVANLPGMFVFPEFSVGGTNVDKFNQRQYISVKP